MVIFCCFAQNWQIFFLVFQNTSVTNLVSAYQNNDINDFEKILKQNRETIMDDPFIREHIEDLLRNIRTQVLIKLIKPYTRIKISFISGELNIETSDVESLLVSCILESTIYGRIDQVSSERKRTCTIDHYFTRCYIGVKLSWSHKILFMCCFRFDNVPIYKHTKDYSI